MAKNKSNYICLGSFNKIIEILERKSNFSKNPLNEDFEFKKKAKANISTGISAAYQENVIFTIHYFKDFELNFKYWIRYKNILYKIINVENIGLNNSYYKITATTKGDDTIVSNYA